MLKLNGLYLKKVALCHIKLLHTVLSSKLSQIAFKNARIIMCVLNLRLEDNIIKTIVISLTCISNLSSFKSVRGNQCQVLLIT